MRICIVGWYGTETLGDRAILDGIQICFGKLYNDISFVIGSLYPFYSERTLLEEKDVFSKGNPSAKFSIFNVKNPKERKENIKNSDLLIMGGGPLMDLRELYIIDECFKYARKKGITTYIMGCGIGPLRNNEYIKVVGSILNNSCKIALRDEISVKNGKEIIGNKDYLCLGDPAVISIERFYAERNDYYHDNSISICLREYPNNDYGKCDYFDFSMMCRMIDVLSKHFDKVLLIPMHTFFVGGDDRFFLTQIYQHLKNDRVELIHIPFNLEKLYLQFSLSKACVGMRYHSVVMQTILNGNNYILDYTDPEYGKISGFINSLPNNEFFKKRVLYMQKKQDEGCIDKICQSLVREEAYTYKKSDTLEKYIEFIS